MAVAVTPKSLHSKTSGCNTENDQICGPFASLFSFILRERAAFGGLGRVPCLPCGSRLCICFAIPDLRHPNAPFSMNQNVCCTLGKLFDGDWPIGIANVSRDTVMGIDKSILLFVPNPCSPRSLVAFSSKCVPCCKSEGV